MVRIVKENNLETKNCNCIKNIDCPLNGNCQTERVIYEATIKSSEPNYNEKVYIGLSEPTFKSRYSCHKRSFNHEKYKNETGLSKEVLKIKKSNHTPSISWRIIKQCLPFNRSSLRCNLCLNEKLEIALYQKDNLLNKRSEIVNKCRHVNKHMLWRYHSNDWMTSYVINEYLVLFQTVNSTDDCEKHETASFE